MLNIRVEDTKIQISEKAFNLSIFFKESFELMEEKEDIIIPNVASVSGKNIVTIENIKKLVELMEYLVDKQPIEIDKPLSKEFDKYVDEWISNYFNSIPEYQILNLAELSNFLNIVQILELCSAKLAEMCKKKTTKQIRELFHIVNDFTPEEEEENKRLNNWMLKL